MSLQSSLPQAPLPERSPTRTPSQRRRIALAPRAWCRVPVLGLLVALAVTSFGCSTLSAPDKRLEQYLNADGFGNRYVGNAEEENYVSLGDTVAVLDTLHTTEIRSNQRVDIDGTILLPELGVVHVAGYTRSELRSILTERYSAYYSETDIQVQIRASGKKYFIFGEVYTEGDQKFEGDLTIFEAVMAAQPRPSSSNLGRVQLIRPDPVDPLIIHVNINDMFRGDSTYNVLVQERDIIFVPPTALASVAYFVKALIFPFTEVIREISSALFYGSRFGQLGQTGNNNNNRGFF